MSAYICCGIDHHNLHGLRTHRACGCSREVTVDGTLESLQADAGAVWREEAGAGEPGAPGGGRGPTGAALDGGGVPVLAAPSEEQVLDDILMQLRTMEVGGEQLHLDQETETAGVSRGSLGGWGCRCSAQRILLPGVQAAGCSLALLPCAG